MIGDCANSLLNLDDCRECFTDRVFSAAGVGVVLLWYDTGLVAYRYYAAILY